MLEINRNEIVFHQSEQYFSAVMEDIDAAKHSIDLETFIFSQDELALRFAQHLIKATKRGVQVRLMVDGVGALFGSTNIERQLLQAGVQIRIYHPLPWRLWQWSHTTRFKKYRWFKRLFLFFTHINVRNHRKVTLIDNAIAWIGSYNITIEHLPYDQGGQNWRDTAIRLQQQDFRDLASAFEAEFYGQHYQYLFRQPSYNNNIRLNNTLQRRRYLQRDLFYRIHRAKQRIWITNAYFVPTEALLRQLCHSAWRGVDVQIILPRYSNHIFMGWAQVVFYQRLLKSGVKIYEYIPSMLHAKTLIIDRWFSIGSTNLNHRSLFRDFEVDVILTTEFAREQTEGQFLIDKQDAKQIFWSGLQMLGWFRRLLGRLVLLWRYWL